MGSLLLRDLHLPMLPSQHGGGLGLCSAHAGLLYGHCKLQPGFLHELSTSHLLGAFLINRSFLLFLDNRLLLLKCKAKAHAWLCAACAYLLVGAWGGTCPHPFSPHAAPHGHHAPGTMTARSPGGVQGQQDLYQGSSKSQLCTPQEPAISSGWTSAELSPMLH